MWSAARFHLPAFCAPRVQPAVSSNEPPCKFEGAGGRPDCDIEAKAQPGNPGCLPFISASGGLSKRRALLSSVRGWAGVETSVTRAPFAFPKTPEKSMCFLMRVTGCLTQLYESTAGPVCPPSPRLLCSVFAAVAESRISSSSRVSRRVSQCCTSTATRGACHASLPLGLLGVCMCPLYLTSQVSVCHVLTPHPWFRHTVSSPQAPAHPGDDEHTPVLQNALAGSHTPGKQRESSIKCESAALCPGSNLRDQSCFFFFSTLCILLYSSIFNQPSFASIPEVSWENESYFLEQRLWAPGDVIMATQRIFCVTLSGVQQSGVLHRVESAPTIWSGGPTQSPRLVLSCFGKDLLWIPSFSSGLNGTSL